MSHPQEKLDFRFALDEIDAQDITNLVNVTHQIETIPSGDVSFRSPGPRISLSQVEKDLLTAGSTRWVVLETPIPEERVVAAARFTMHSSNDSRIGLVDIICAVGDGVNSQELQHSRFARILSKIESVVWSHFVDELVIEVPNWRTDIQEVLGAVGYEDRGGHMWPADSEIALTKPTMICEFKRKNPLKLGAHSAASSVPSSTGHIMQSQLFPPPPPTSATVAAAPASAQNSAMNILLRGAIDAMSSEMDVVSEGVSTIQLDDDTPFARALNSSSSTSWAMPPPPPAPAPAQPHQNTGSILSHAAAGGVDGGASVSESTGGAGGERATMENLVKSLFGALHKEL